jgi:hypothetical protein
MPHDVSAAPAARRGDGCHARVSARADLLIACGWLALLTLLLPSLAAGQSSASLQVAAHVLYAEPSRAALTLATQSLKETRPAVRESALAQVTVSPAADRPATPRIRCIRVDFLRN